MSGVLTADAAFSGSVALEPVDEIAQRSDALIRKPGSRIVSRRDEPADEAPIDA